MTIVTIMIIPFVFRVIINDSLDKGSMIPWVKRAAKEGYAVVILNPNENEREINGKTLPVQVTKFLKRLFDTTRMSSRL